MITRSLRSFTRVESRSFQERDYYYYYFYSFRRSADDDDDDSNNHSNIITGSRSVRGMLTPPTQPEHERLCIILLFNIIQHT